MLSFHMQSKFHTTLLHIANGAYDVSYLNQRYLLTKSTHLKGQLIKLYAEELGGNNFISLNYYTHKQLLKPCEMPVLKVMDFILKMEIL